MLKSEVNRIILGNKMKFKQIYLLMRGEDSLGEVAKIRGDYPWDTGVFEPYYNYREVSYLFWGLQEMMALKRYQDLERIRFAIEHPSIYLKSLETEQTFQIYAVEIEGDRIYWRWD